MNPLITKRDAFIICAIPSGAWRRYFDAPQSGFDDVALWKRRSRLESLSSARSDLLLVHPTAGQEHVVTLLSAAADPGQLVVTTPNAMDRLMEPGGLLLFRDAPSEDILQIHFENRDKSQLFRRVDAIDLGLSGNYLDRNDLGLARRCYKWASDAPEKASSVLNVDVKIQPELWSRSSTALETAWLNPVIVRVALDGNELGCGACADREPDAEASPMTREEERYQVLRCMTDPQSLLYVQPVFDASYDARMVMLDHLDAWRNEADPSGAERLYFGRESARDDEDTAMLDSPSWLPFLGLDSLGGDFVVTGHGRSARYGWGAPSSLSSANARWLARHLVQRWDGDETSLAGEIQAFPKTPRTREECGRPSVVSLPLDETLSDAQSRPGRLLRRVAETEQGDRRLYDRISEFLEHPEIRNTSVVRALRAAWHVEVEDRQQFRHRVLFDKTEFLMRLCAAVLQPRSDVWLKLDVPYHTLSKPMERQTVGALGDRWLNVFDTPSLGQRDWVERVVGLAGRPRKHEVDIPFDSGWWVDWLETFFSARWDAKAFLESGSFLLDQARADVGRLDVQPAEYRQSAFVRF